MEYTRKLLEGILDPFLIRDLATLCFSYCEVKEYLAKEFPQEENLITAGVIFCHDLYTLVNYYEEFRSGIRSLSPEGKLLREWNTCGEGKRIAEYSGISGNPSRDQIYALDFTNNYVQVFSINGNYLRQFPLGNTARQYANICVSSRNEIFVNSENTVEVFNPEGELLKGWSGEDVS